METGVLDAAAFPATNRDLWLKLVARALNGADFEEALVSHSDDGIAIEPLYERRTGANPLLRQWPGRPWTITQRMDDPDARRSAAQLKGDMAGGATGIALVMADSSSSFGAGIESGDREAFLSAIAEHDVAADSIRVESGAFAAGAALSNLSGKFNAMRLHCGVDPLLAAAFAGSPASLAELPEKFIFLAESVRAGTVFNADGRLVHNAGGTEAQELAFVAASVAEYVRALDAGGLPPKPVLPYISLCLSADQDQFLTIAKARAARLIFARIAELCGATSRERAHVFMETSYRMLTRLDPETNILRNTIAVFAAGIGGADEISVLPHTITHGIPDPLARRLARNTQVILAAESHLDHVGDPAAGAGGIEALTEALAGKAWEIFTGIERDGGLAKVIGNGKLAAMVGEARAARPARPIVGTTLFAMKEERPLTVLAPLRDPAPGTGLRPMRFDEVIE